LETCRVHSRRQSSQATPRESFGENCMASYSGFGATSGICNVCGKRLKSCSPEAMAAHQRESTTCVGAPSKNAPEAVRKAEAALLEAVEEEKRVHAEGNYEAIEAHAVKRKQAEAAVKNARAEAKQEKQKIKNLAAASMSAANWTASLTSALDGNSEAGRFSKGDSAIEEKLATATVGLVTAEAFREKRVALEAEVEQRRQEEEEGARLAEAQRARKKQEKKRKREQAERRGLSFEEEGDE
jgi:hypothetical protein